MTRSTYTTTATTQLVSTLEQTEKMLLRSRILPKMRIAYEKIIVDVRAELARRASFSTTSTETV